MDVRTTKRPFSTKVCQQSCFFENAATQHSPFRWAEPLVAHPRRTDADSAAAHSFRSGKTNFAVEVSGLDGVCCSKQAAWWHAHATHGKLPTTNDICGAAGNHQ